MNKQDRDLGMHRAITRRDFINGVGVTVGAGMAMPALDSTAMAQPRGPAAPIDPAVYPPGRHGLRGAHPGSFEAAHTARVAATSYDDARSTGETYDLVVVGGGLSGLAAAYYFRKKAGASAKILVLDNHDDFGGHAKRNEYVHNGKLLMATGGSAYMVAPSTWTPQALQILKDLGIEKGHPTHKIDRDVYRSLGLRPGVFFRKEKYGADTLVVGGSLNNPTKEFLSKTPMPPAVAADLVRLYRDKIDYLPGLSKDEKIERLQKMTYRDYLLNVAKVHPDVPPLLGGVWALGTDLVSAWFAYYRYKPGFDGLGVERPADSPEGPEHTADDFRLPAGNSDIARMIVRALIPASLPQGSFADVQSTRVNYATLDEADARARIRLNSTAVRVRHVGRRTKGQFQRDTREVETTYMRDGRLHTVTSKDVVLACNNAMIPFLCPELPDDQKAALHASVRAVNQTTNVLLRNFEAFAELGVSNVACPNSFYGGFSLMSQMSLGDYAPPRDPSQPILASFSSGANSGMLSNEAMTAEVLGGTPLPPGTPMQEQFRAMRNGLLKMPFEAFERHVRSQASRALAGSHFDPARDILAITVNRWPHGFAMSRNALFDPDTPEHEAPCVTARRKLGHIAIANSDASGIDLVQTAFDEAYRAIWELEPRRYGYYERI